MICFEAEAWRNSVRPFFEMRRITIIPIDIVGIQ